MVLLPERCSNDKIKLWGEAKMRKLSIIAADLRASKSESEIVAAIKNREIVEIEEGYITQQNYPKGVYVFCDEEIGGILFGSKEVPGAS